MINSNNDNNNTMCSPDPVEQKEKQQAKPKQRRRRTPSRRMREENSSAPPSSPSSVVEGISSSSNTAGPLHNKNNNTVGDSTTMDNAKGRSSTTRSSGIGRLFVCATGICVCYLYYGILQERLFSSGKEEQRRRRLGATFVLVTQCLANVLVACFWQQVQGLLENKSRQQHQSKSNKYNNNNKEKKKSDETVVVTTEKKDELFGLHHALLVLTSGCYVAAMACSNEAIQYVSYPVAVLAKSCKLIPAMLVGQLIEGRLYSRREWMAALLISSGIVLFHSSRLAVLSSQNNNNNNDKMSKNEDASSSNNDRHVYGLILLLISLAMDGLLSSCQNFLKRPPAANDDQNDQKKNKNKAYRPPNAVETMLYVNLYALLFLIPLAVVTGQWTEGIARLLGQSATTTATAEATLVGWDLCRALLLLNATVAIGQIFIFLTIHWYSPLVTTTITTTRKFFTILLSVLTFGHEFTRTQWMAVALVFSGLYFAILVPSKTRPSRVDDSGQKDKQE